MHSFHDYFPAGKIRPIPFAPDAGWSAFNPSIARNPQGQYAMIMRSSNYHMTDIGEYIINDDSGVIRTRNHFCELDSETLGIARVAEVDDSFGDTVVPPTSYPVRGIEDARLFWCGGWAYIGTSRQHRADGLHEPCVDLFTEEGGVVRRNLISTPNGQLAKNVVPMENGTTFLWQPMPWTVAEVDAQYRWLTDPNPLPPGNFKYRGGGHVLVTARGGYLTVVHSVSWASNGMRFYWHHWVLHQDGHTIIGKPWYFINPGIEFAAGLVRHHDNLVVTFGVHDREAAMATVRESDVLASLGS